MKIAIYAKCASRMQGTTDPVEDQIVACRNRAEVLGRSVKPNFIYRDIGVSGISPIRGCPGLRSLLEDASRVPRRFDLVVVLDSVRLGRSHTRVSEVYRTLHGSGVRIVFANGEELRGIREKKDHLPQSAGRFRTGELSMSEAIAYARLACDDQYSTGLNAQVEELNTYAATHALTIVKTIAHVGIPAHEQFGLLSEYIRNNHVRIVITRDVTRLSGCLLDFLVVQNLIEDLDIEIRFVQDGSVMQKTSLSAARLFRDLRFIMAKRYMDDPAISIVRGQIAKAELGQYPGRAPYGYSHDPQNRRIVPHPTKADVVRSIFRLYALRSCSAAELRKTVAGETRTWIAKSQLFRILRSSFYVGHFTWGGREFSGTHEPLVDPVTFARVQEIISRGKRNRSK